VTLSPELETLNPEHQPQPAGDLADAGVLLHAIPLQTLNPKPQPQTLNPKKVDEMTYDS
jgi:hypothetical protein